MTDSIGDYTRVRIADERDGEDLLEMCRFLHGENGVFAMDEAKVKATLNGALTGDPMTRTTMVGVIGEPGDLQGSIFLEVDSFWYTTEACLMEVWNYVYPQFRSSSNSRDLIAFSKRVSDTLKMPLMIGILSNERTEAKVRLYRRQLGETSGAFFLYGAQTGRGVH